MASSQLARRSRSGNMGTRTLLVASGLRLVGRGWRAGAPTPQAQTVPPPYQSEQIGSGPARVALILPMTQASGPSVVGTSLRNAAELAWAEAGNNDITLLVKDDRSTPEGARAAAQAALSEGAELIIGPLFASSVREVGQVARGGGKPVIAFSTDTSTAGPELFLLSFLIEGYVDRIVDFAAAKGEKSIAALIPENDYGRVAENEFQQAAARDNIRVMTIEHYQPRTISEAVQKIAALHDQIDSLFIPEQADAMQAMSQALAAAGINGKHVQILGTGLWNDARVLKLAGCKEHGSRRPKMAVSMPSRRATAPNISPIQPESQRLPTTPCPSPPRLPTPKARSVIRQTSSPTGPASTAPMACFASAPMGPTSAVYRSCKSIMAPRCRSARRRIRSRAPLRRLDINRRPRSSVGSALESSHLPIERQREFAKSPCVVTAAPMARACGSNKKQVSLCVFSASAEMLARVALLRK